MSQNLPSPYSDESPSTYAARLGEWYIAKYGTKKALGQYFTPRPVASFMANLLLPSQGYKRVLDPCAGTGILACSVCEILSEDIDLVVYEVDSDLAIYLEASLHYLKMWMQARQRVLRFEIIRGDFIMAHAWALQWSSTNIFDIVIINPPYFKLAKTDMRAKAAAVIIHGQPNIYAIFMALSAALLKENGQLVCLTPRSYASGQYFKQFRQFFFGKVLPKAVHLFESRRDLFNNVLQESIILLAERTHHNSLVRVSTSTSATDLSECVIQHLPLSEVLKDNILHLATSEEQATTLARVRGWSARLHDYGLRVSTGPVVAFRATHFVTATGNVPETHAPLLWMQNVRPMRVLWTLPHEGQYILRQGAEKLLIPNQNYVLIRRFTAKEERQRLVAAAYLAHLETPLIGLENHLNYIHRPGGYLSVEEAQGFAALLNSQLMDGYFRTFNGNTQVSATELMALPLPPLDAIREMGRRVLEGMVDCDALVADVLNVYV